MSRPPFLMRNSISASAGFAWLRFGPAVPVEPAAASVWQAAHPELAKSDEPLPGLPTGMPASGLSGAPVVGGAVAVGVVVVFPPPAPAADFGITFVVLGTTTPTPISPLVPATACPSAVDRYSYFPFFSVNLSVPVSPGSARSTDLPTQVFAVPPFGLRQTLKP